jgi:hypothetical protein
MTILNPEHLLDQAGALLDAPRGGPRRQANLRRAISTAYYAVFHAILIAAADRIIGRSRRGTPHYALVYRSIDHRALSGFCSLISRSTLAPKYHDLSPPGGFAADIILFARNAADLQQERHSADYDPRYRVGPTKASVLIGVARDSIGLWNAAANEQREAFLLPLLFPPR